MTNIMKIVFKTGLFLIILSCFCLINSCKKDKPTIPELTTTTVTGITATTAISGGTITSAGGVSITVCGICWSTNINPTPSDNITVDVPVNNSFTSHITGLEGGKTYYLRAYATNDVGTGFGTETTFTTSGQVPSVATLASTNITNTSAILNGTVNANYLASIVTFEYGTSMAYSNIVTAIQSPVSGNTLTNVNVSIDELTAGTTYHYRIKATNSLGTTFGNDMTITTFINGLTGTIGDNDGNIYKTIGIGNQMWMAENLKTTKYNDGEAISLVTDNDIWRNLVTSGYCWYDNAEASYKATYGALYNGYAVNTGKLCPTGWHVPTRSEWSILVTYLGGFLSDAGGKLKEAGTTHWLSPNTGATNLSGFTGLPGGSRDYYWGSFGYGASTVNPYGFWWTSTIDLPNTLWYHSLHYWDSYVGGSASSLKYGYSVRCIKD